MVALEVIRPVRAPSRVIVGANRLDGPNDLAFGPDGRLWFTDPRGDSDPAKNSRPGSHGGGIVSTSLVVCEPTTKAK